MSRANVLIQCDVLLFCLVISLDVLTDSELLDIPSHLVGVFSATFSYHTSMYIRILYSRLNCIKHNHRIISFSDFISRIAC